VNVFKCHKCVGLLQKQTQVNIHDFTDSISRHVNDHDYKRSNRKYGG